MIVQTYFPRRLSPARYDQYLASGWFRGSVMLYKMGMLCMEGDIQSVLNIRLNLKSHEASKSQRKVLSKGSKRFRFEIKPARLNDRKEELYQQHKQRFKGFIHHSLSDYLQSGFLQTVFDTYELDVWDGDQLVAVSFFDRGQQSMAGLLCVYAEGYSKFSLGKLTMLLEVEHAKSLGIKWYYPGYVLTPSPSFDYKLELGEFQYYNARKRWVKLGKSKPSQTMGGRFKASMVRLEGRLRTSAVEHKVWLYPFFTMGFLEYWEVVFFGHPMFFEIPFGRPGEEMLLVSFDVDQEVFKLQMVSPAEEYYHLLNMEVSEDFYSNKEYFMDLLRVKQLVFATTDVDEMCQTIASISNAVPPQSS